jgi:hypothetical protein
LSTHLTLSCFTRVTVNVFAKTFQKRPGENLPEKPERNTAAEKSGADKRIMTA